MRALLYSICLLYSVLTDAAQVTVPSEVAKVEGNENTAFPFGVTPSFGIPSMRYQQVYDASEFAALSAEGEFITTIYFRVDTDTGHNFTCVIRDMQINLSTTQNSPDGLRTNFTQNVGTDDTVVWNRGQFIFGA